MTPLFGSQTRGGDDAAASRISLLWKRISWPWLGPLVLLIGWGPLILADLVLPTLIKRGMTGPHDGAGYAIGWVALVTIPTTFLGVCSVLFHIFSAIYRFL